MWMNTETIARTYIAEATKPRKALKSIVGLLGSCAAAFVARTTIMAVNKAPRAEINSSRSVANAWSINPPSKQRLTFREASKLVKRRINDRDVSGVDGTRKQSEGEGELHFRFRSSPTNSSAADARFFNGLARQ
jgi:hypothetical protein